jgi:RNA polymerase sigma factor (TIGR02999 family)
MSAEVEHTVSPEGPGSEDLGPLDDLIPVIFDELRAMAHRQLAREREGVTLQTTDVVHEAYLRLAKHESVTRRGRPYFYAAAARAMRQVLVDAARRRHARKRDAGQAVSLSDREAADVDGYSIELMELDQALTDLGRQHPRLARTVECRFFGGMTVEDTAAALGVSPRTVKSDWAMARSWLFEALRQASA